MKYLFFAGAFLLMALNFSCEKKETKAASSSFGATTHHAGDACVACHATRQICGTVYDTTMTKTVPNVVVKLSTTHDASGQIKSTYQVDKSGNFYTDDKTDVTGLFPLVVYQDGTKAEYMQSAITTGNCNACHIEGERIWIK